MKYILLILAIVIFSCSRDNNGLNNINGDPEIEYNLDGKHFKHTGQATTANALYGVGVFKVSANPATNAFYKISGLTNTGNSIFIHIVTDSLKEITYRVKGLNAGFISGADSYILFEVEDYIDVIIDSYKNGIVNGRFSGNVSKVIPAPFGFQPATLTGGIIKNNKVQFF